MCSRSPQILEFGHFKLLGSLRSDDGNTNENVTRKYNFISFLLHVLRINDQRVPKLLLYGELAEGKRQVGRPKLRFKDNLKAALKSLYIPVQTSEDLASDLPQWRRMISRGAESAEQHRRATAERKRAARKAKTVGDTTQPPASLKCSICDRHFRARIGLINHMRTHTSSQ